MAWYFGPDNEWTPKDLADCDFAYDLIDQEIFRDYNQLAKYLEEHADDIVEVTSTEDGLGYFDTTFVTEGEATLNLMTMTAIGDILEEE